MLDTNVLVDAQLRDIFLALAEQDHIEYWWTDHILGELRQVFVHDLRRPAEKVDRLTAAIRSGFPLGDASIDATVTRYFSCPDQDDVPVLAAAVHSEVDIIVTHDRGGFPPDDVLSQWDLAVLTPGEALDEMIDALGGEVVAAAFVKVTRALQRPRRNLLDQLRRLEKVAPSATAEIADLLDLGSDQD